MAVPVADLQTWRDALVQARMTGTRRVRDADGSEIEYRSDSEIARAIAAADAMISAASPPITTIRFDTSKGLE
jgi:hypothetical protein